MCWLFNSIVFSLGLFSLYCPLPTHSIPDTNKTTQASGSLAGTIKYDNDLLSDLIMSGDEDYLSGDDVPHSGDGKINTKQQVPKGTQTGHSMPTNTNIAHSTSYTGRRFTGSNERMSYGGLAMSDEKRLIKHLLENYERVGLQGRPVYNTYGMSTFNFLVIFTLVSKSMPSVWFLYILEEHFNGPAPLITRWSTGFSGIPMYSSEMSII